MLGKAKYTAAETILHECISLYPEYSDAYAALFDVYYWSENQTAAQALIKCMHHNNVNTVALTKKILRAKQRITNLEAVSR